MNMEIKILVPENKEQQLKNFITSCESQGFEVINQGGGRLPNFSGYYATLNGSNWFSNNALLKQIDRLKQQIELYKECFAEFIPLDKYDEATSFLSTSGYDGLANELSNKGI